MGVPCPALLFKFCKLGPPVVVVAWCAGKNL